MEPPPCLQTNNLPCKVTYEQFIAWVNTEVGTATAYADEVGRAFQEHSVPSDCNKSNVLALMTAVMQAVFEGTAAAYYVQGMHFIVLYLLFKLTPQDAASVMRRRLKTLHAAMMMAIRLYRNFTDIINP